MLMSCHTGTAAQQALPAGPVTEVKKLLKILVLRSGGLRVLSVAHLGVTEYL